uniref:Uncharacterized protein n=1 Tax=Hyaloperonospora arabidopsidis (strain Emoy2) TaxID=559515 RepID=M4BK28_HYAAE
MSMVSFASMLMSFWRRVQPSLQRIEDCGTRFTLARIEVLRDAAVTITAG